MSRKQFNDVCCKYGAPMGRTEYHDSFVDKARCFKVNMVDHCYDDGGAYWGTSNYPTILYCATNSNGFMMFTRKPDRESAKEDFQFRASSICGNKKGNTILWIN